MTLSLYEATLPNYLQILRSVSSILDKGAEHAIAQGGTPDDYLELRLADDMLPMSFQIVSVWHHSLGTMRGLEAGLFQPPPKLEIKGWEGYTGLIAEAIAEFEVMTAEQVNDLSGRPMMFKMGDLELPFTTDSFVQTFSMPNFHFHATTVYALLRSQGVELGKLDYIGALRLASA